MARQNAISDCLVHPRQLILLRNTKETPQDLVHIYSNHHIQIYCVIATENGFVVLP